jgi:hypothetical protein
MRYREITESALDVIHSAQALTQRHGVKASITANGPNEIDLTWIERTTGTKGSGASFMADLIRLADQNDVRIMLSVWKGEPKLIELYKRFGFQMFDEGDEDEEPVMVRDP